MHLILPDSRKLSLDFEPLLTLTRDPQFHIQEIVDQLNGGGFREMVEAAAGGIVVDLGANVGLFSLYMASTARTVFSLEPSPEHFHALLDVIHQTGTQNIIPMQRAIAAENGPRRFYQNEENRTADSFYPIGPHTVINVPCLRLDKLFSDYGIDGAALVKCDIEGAEVDVLRDPTFPTVAQKIRAFYLECHNFKEWVGGDVVVAEMRDVLERCFPNVTRTGTNNLYATGD